MNNINIYLFGVLKNGYAQTIDDHTRPILEEFVRETTASTQIFVRRKEQLIYYGYVRRLDTPSACLGLCVEANDWLIADVSQLFSAFEDVMEHLLLEGKIASLDETMHTVPSIADFSEVSSEVEMVASRLRGLFAQFSVHERLPFAATNISHTSVRKLAHDASREEAKASFVRNGLTIILKQEDYEGAIVAKYHRQIETLQKDFEQKNKEAEVLYKALSRTTQEVKDLQERPPFSQSDAQSLPEEDTPVSPFQSSFSSSSEVYSTNELAQNTESQELKRNNRQGWMIVGIGFVIGAFLIVLAFGVKRLTSNKEATSVAVDSVSTVTDSTLSSYRDSTEISRTTGRAGQVLSMSGRVNDMDSSIKLLYGEDGKPEVLSLQRGEDYYTCFYAGADDGISIFHERTSDDTNWMFIGLELETMGEIVRGTIMWKTKGKKTQSSSFTMLIDTP